MSNRIKRKYGKFQIVEPDCKATFDDVVVKVFNLSNKRPKIEYNVERVPQEIKAAVKLWVKSMKFGGMSLQDYLHAMFRVGDFK